MDEAGLLATNLKICRACKNSKQFNLFVKNKTCKNGIDTICLDCSRHRVKLWRQSGKRNSAKESKLYYLRYPEKNRARSAKRRARVLNQTPIWANFSEIKKFYISCPAGYHVDHIVPLKGKMCQDYMSLIIYNIYLLKKI